VTFAIVTDTASDVIPEIRARDDVFVVSTQIIVDGREFTDTELSKQELLRYFDQGLHSTTSQPTPEEFHRVYSEALDTFPEVLGIHVGSKMSGLFNGASLIASDLASDILLYDTHSVSFGAGYFVYCAARLKDAGYTRQQIIDIFDKIQDQIHLRVLIEDVGYIKRGGRVSVSQYWLLKTFRLRPVVKNHEGKIVPAGMVIGRKNGIKKIVAHLQKVARPTDVVYIGHANTPRDLEILREIADEKLNPPIQAEISSTLLSHVGPRALGIMIAPSIKSYLENK
jgi:DegV family protein with EDD domain